MQKIRKKSSVLKKVKTSNTIKSEAADMFGKKKTMGEMRFAKARTGHHSRRTSQKFERIRRPVNLSESGLDCDHFVAFQNAAINSRYYVVKK